MERAFVHGRPIARFLITDPTRTPANVKKPEYSTVCHGVKNVSSSGTWRCAHPSRYTPPMNHAESTTTIQSNPRPPTACALLTDPVASGGLWESRWEDRHGLCLEVGEICYVASMVNVNAHDMSIGIKIHYDPGAHFDRIHSRPVHQVYRKRVSLRIVSNLHRSLSGVNRRSGNALWMVSPSAKVTTRRYFPSSRMKIQ